MNELPNLQLMLAGTKSLEVCRVVQGFTVPELLFNSHCFRTDMLLR